MSAFIVNRDTIDLLITLAVTRRIRAGHQETERVLTAVVDHADHYGAVLWEANHAAHRQSSGSTVEAPPYEWRPVMELIVGDVTGEQLVQIERSRRTLVEQSQAAPDWEGSDAATFLDLLRRVIEQRLSSWARVPTLEVPTRADYAGLRATDPHWTREAGLPVGNLFDDAAS